MRTLTSMRMSPVLKNFFIYSGGTILLKSISVILMPFILAVLPPEQYGLFSLAMSFTTILVIISGCGLRQVFGIEFFHCDSAGRRRMAQEIIVLYLALNIPLALLALGNIPVLNKLLFFGTGSTTLVILCLIFCFLQFFTELFYQVLRYQGKALTLSLVQIGTALTTISLNLFFLYHFPWGISGMLFGYSLGSLIPFFAGVYAYWKAGCLPTALSIKPIQKIRSMLTRPQVQKGCYYLRLGFPFIPGMLFNWILVAGNRWILARYGTLHDVGIYALADTFGQLYTTLILYPLAGSYIPDLMYKFSRTTDTHTIEKENRRIMYFSMLGMAILITIGYLAGKPLIRFVLPARYQEAIGYIWLVLMGQIFLMGTYFTSALVQFRKKTTFLAASLCAPAAINMGMGIMLTRFFGIYGCILATLIAYIVYFVSMLWYNNTLLVTGSNKHTAKQASTS